MCVPSRAPTASFHDSKHGIVHIHYEATTGNLLTSGTDKVIKVRVPPCSSYSVLVPPSRRNWSRFIQLSVRLGG